MQLQQAGLGGQCDGVMLMQSITRGELRRREEEQGRWACRHAPAAGTLLVLPGSMYDTGRGQKPSATLQPKPLQPQSHTHLGSPFLSLQAPFAPQKNGQPTTMSATRSPWNVS